MRTISTDEIIKNIREMCIEANYHLSDDVKKKIMLSEQREESPLGKKILCQLEKNLDIAQDGKDTKYLENVSKIIKEKVKKIPDAEIYTDVFSRIEAKEIEEFQYRINYQMLRMDRLY